ncbi:putative diguanylate cyclase AdrA [Marinomonas spartinae]|uniref:diguanylate cyclase n=1 Tax=Marinomonas spartinae TaxID=1792290 RepID=A0A1A8T6Z6_9GAMM|nr:GGDEF domain-containing protein [Marinomonas spartinae]SBS27529.1 putative diguanylate cyclase AdrA [Marinomonas spartinae]SBS29921.1 putative diguanylate cyclase AdrA [Marinomonas spartinae]
MHPNKHHNQHVPNLPLAVHKGLSLIICAITFFYSLWNLVYLKLYLLASVELIIVSFSLFFFIQALKNQDKEWQHYTLVGMITVLVLLTPLQGDIRAGSLYWSILLPFVYFMMFGSRGGLILSLLLVFPVLYIIYTKTTHEGFLPYRAMVNYTLAHFCVWCLCYVYESQHQKDNLRLRNMALEDSLTGLKNRYALDAAFEHIDQHNIKAFMLLIDIDHFKAINDKFGHDIGNQILIEMADNLQMYANEEDVYRLGGEEFIIILSEKCEQEIYSTAESLRCFIENTLFHQHDLRLQLTISVGISRFLPGQSLSDFLRSADHNLYLAKQQGRNKVNHTLF